VTYRIPPWRWRSTKTPRSARTGLTAASALLLSICFAWPTASHALQFDDTPTKLRLALSTDFIHANGAYVVSGRYGGPWGATLGLWADAGDVRPEPAMFVGVDRAWTIGKFRAGLGAAWIDKTTNISGTRWQFDVYVAYDITSRMFIQYRHFSHGARFGIKEDVPNGGWNLLGLGVTF
jgi:hypothetical protein